MKLALEFKALITLNESQLKSTSRGNRGAVIQEQGPQSEVGIMAPHLITVDLELSSYSKLKLPQSLGKENGQYES